MKLELDPDFRLATRLTLGRGRNLVFLVGVAVYGAFVVLTDIDWSKPLPVWRGALYPIVLTILLFTASRFVARLLDLERGGRLDQIRLCGRPPGRILLGFFVGSIWPYIVVSAALFHGAVLQMGWYGRCTTARIILLFGAAIAVALTAY